MTGVQTCALPIFLLENLLRTEDGANVTRETIAALGNWDASAEPSEEIQFTPARVVMQDFTGVPVVVDLATMREAVKDLGGDPEKIEPLAPAELVIDHSVIADFFGTADAADRNEELEYERNQERYQFLRWGQGAFEEFKVVPPGQGIVHQVNIEALARVVMARHGQAYPDTVVGTDSHTTMVNGLGVLGWGVGGIEAEAAMLGQPVSMLIPRVVGFKLTGDLPAGATATDLVLTITEMLRKHGVVGKFVEFYGNGVAHVPLANRATIGNMSPEYGSTVAIFPIDDETLHYLRLTGRSPEQVALVDDEVAVERDRAVPHREVEVAAREAARVLVRPRREEEVAREHARLEAVRLVLVDHRQRVPARALVHAPADVADGVRLLLAEGGEVRAHQVGVALDRGDAVAGDLERDRALHVRLEGEVDVTGGQHDAAVDGARRGERDDEAARVVRERAGAARPAPRARRERAGEAHAQVGAVRRGDVHLLGRAQAREARLDARPQVGVDGKAVERLGVLVADHQHAGADAEDRRELRRVDQPLDGAVDHEVRRGQRGDGGGLSREGDEIGRAHV